MKFGTKTEMETKKVKDRTGPTKKYRDMADQLIGYAVIYPCFFEPAKLYILYFAIKLWPQIETAGKKG